MKKLILTLCSMMALSLSAQQNNYTTYWNQRASLFEELPLCSNDIVFIGNSITDGAEWFELLDNPHIKNRGISGDISMGIYDRLQPIIKGKPEKVFLMIGINDLARGISVDSVATNVARIIDRLQAETPATKIYLQSVLPVTDEKNMFTSHTARREDIAPLNTRYRQIAADKNITYVDLYSGFVDPATGKMNLTYSNDGLHLLGAGYLKWAHIVKPYVEEK